VKTKNKIKKSTLRRDYLEVVAEDIRDQVKAIGEGHKMLDEKLGRNLIEIKKEFGIVQSNFKTVFEFQTQTGNNFKTVFEFQTQTGNNFKTVFEYLSNIDDELKAIKNEIGDLKEKLKNKADLVRLETLELRIDKIERELAHSATR